MNWLKRLFNRRIEKRNLDELILSLEPKQFLENIYKTHPEGYTPKIFGYFNTKHDENGVLFNVDIYSEHFNSKTGREGDDWLGGKTYHIKKTIPYKEFAKNPILKKYDKKRGLISSLSILSIASILASAFFISNNITGNAILTNNSNSSGIIGAGLFVLGVISWIFARNI